jgi:hypothetical protein
MNRVDASLLSTAGASDGDALTYVSANNRMEFAAGGGGGGGGGGVAVYANTDTIPLSGVTIGSLAYVESTNRLYVWQPGWYNIPLTAE